MCILDNTAYKNVFIRINSYHVAPRKLIRKECSPQVANSVFSNVLRHPLDLSNTCLSCTGVSESTGGYGMPPLVELLYPALVVQCCSLKI